MALFRSICGLFLASAVVALQITHAAEHIRILENGSIDGSFGLDTNALTNLVLDFGMPHVTPVRRWREGQAYKTQWSTNGVLYTQTVLLTDLVSSLKEKSQEPVTVMLVNIEGENTNSEYTDAFASLSLLSREERVSLQLINGVVHAQDANCAFTLGTLEVPESGIKTAEGKRLEFYGAMPPSIRGGMTLKIPLNRPQHALDTDRLLELDYEPAYRQSSRSGATSNPAHARLGFYPDARPTPSN